MCCEGTVFVLMSCSSFLWFLLCPLIAQIILTVIFLKNSSSIKSLFLIIQQHKKMAIVARLNIPNMQKIEHINKTLKKIIKTLFSIINELYWKWTYSALYTVLLVQLTNLSTNIYCWYIYRKMPGRHSEEEDPLSSRYKTGFLFVLFSRLVMIENVELDAFLCLQWEQ